MRNLIYPLNWEEVFAYVGFPAFLKPYAAVDGSTCIKWILRRSFLKTTTGLAISA